MEKRKFDVSSDEQVMLYTWDKVEKPIGVLQLVHGMAEHAARYDDFATYLNSKGYIVVANDLRGHGLTAVKDTWGYEKGDMWENNISDQIFLSKYLTEKYNLPLILMGHSYGSFLTQRMIEVNKYPIAFVLSGSCYMNNLIVKLGKIIAKNMCKSKGDNFPAAMIANMSFNSYDKHFNEGKNAWLSKEPKNVEKYNKDVMCGFICSAGFYRSFFTGLLSIYAKDNLARVNLDKPIYIFSGAEDPVGEYGKGVESLNKMYNKLNVKNVTMRLYADCRHEMLNESNKQEVYDDVVNYLNSVIKA